MGAEILGERDFANAYSRFQDLHVSFDEGLLASWESYKPVLRQRAISELGSAEWNQSSIGTGAILDSAIRAIELEDLGANTHNNLLMWQNRYGHASRDHFVLLDARQDQDLCRETESLLFDLYRGDEAEEARIFSRFSELSGKRYPFVAFLFFLKDMRRFTPVRQTAFGRAFRALGADSASPSFCSWSNYRAFLETLNAIRELLVRRVGIPDVSLIDAHSFCWVFAWLIRLEAEGNLLPGETESGAARTFGAKERSIYEMCRSITHTVDQSNGQLVERRVKDKSLNLSTIELEQYLRELLDRQNNRCALTGLAFQFNGLDSDSQLAPSADRIDSDGHYEKGNIQVVCRFINFWKGSMDDSEFRRLLALVRSGGTEPHLPEEM